MKVTIIVENNLKEILQYLEEFDFKWRSGGNPINGSEWDSKAIILTDKVIQHTTSDKIDPFAISFEKFKQRFVHGIWLEPGMVLSDINNEHAIVIPHKDYGIAFVSYSYNNSWATCLDNILKGELKEIRDIPRGNSITDGELLWKKLEFKVNDYTGIHQMNKKELHKYIDKCTWSFCVEVCN